MDERMQTNKKKIVILTNNGSGLIAFREELLRNLSAENEVLVCLPDSDSSEDIKKAGCQVLPIDFDRRGMNPIRDLNLYRSYKRILKQERPAAVITYTVKPNVYGGRACAALKIPYLANITGMGTAIENGGLLSKLTLMLYKAGLKKANCVFFQNQHNLDFFTKKGIVHGNTRRIPGSGVNLERHCFEQYPAEADGVSFLFVGRIMRDKGVNELLEAFRVVHSAHPNVMLRMLGGFDEDYHERIRQAEEEGYLQYYGVQKNVHPYYRDAHCIVLPTYHEGMANVLLEAASTGRPVIATRVPGCLETFDEGETGLGCDVKNAESLRLAVEAFLAGSEEAHRQMGWKAREKMQREFDRGIVIRAYLEEMEKATR